MVVGSLPREQRTKAALLSSWFFVTVATLWLLKPVRMASLLAHLGAVETPYVRLASVVAVGAVVMFYSAVVNRLSRINVVRWSHAIFGAVLVAFWLAIRWWPAIGAERAFVWGVYILVDIYSVVMIEIFWTYTNDIVTSAESNRLYAIIGMGGILGGTVGGAFVDGFARAVGPINLLLICAGMVAASAQLGALTERVLHPPQRHLAPAPKKKRTFATALDGAREVRASRYLMLMVGVVIAYEIAATLADFGINVVFEHSFTNEVELVKMYGRLGWIVSITAIVVQMLIVPFLLPAKRVALLLPPAIMFAGAVGVVIVPVIATAVVLAAADRGLNYSIQQSTKESLYVPLNDAQKYKAKAFIDMFVDRVAKALAAFFLIFIIRTAGESVRLTLVVSCIAMMVWLGSARRLGAYWHKGLPKLDEEVVAPAPAPPPPTEPTHSPTSQT